MVRMQCDWSHEGAHCKNEAVFLCSHPRASHIVCARHSVDARSGSNRRKTDRICGCCGRAGMIPIFEDAHPIERRKAGSEDAVSLSA